MMKTSLNKQRAAAAEVALKAHVLKSNPGMLAELPGGRRRMENLAELVNLTEATEDAVCDLVTNLMHYCHRERINWTDDITRRALNHFRCERADESKARDG
jgi:hypothetical protein